MHKADRDYLRHHYRAAAEGQPFFEQARLRVSTHSRTHPSSWRWWEEVYLVAVVMHKVGPAFTSRIWLPGMGDQFSHRLWNLVRKGVIPDCFYSPEGPRMYVGGGRSEPVDKT